MPAGEETIFIFGSCQEKATAADDDDLQQRGKEETGKDARQTDEELL